MWLAGEDARHEGIQDGTVGVPAPAGQPYIFIQIYPKSLDLDSSPSISIHKCKSILCDLQMLPLTAATSFEHRGPQCLLTLTRSTSPPLDQFLVRVCSCPLWISTVCDLLEKTLGMNGFKMEQLDYPLPQVGHIYIGLYTILPSPILYQVWHTQGRPVGGCILRNGRAIVLQ